jgi:hypothetical protein
MFIKTVDNRLINADKVVYFEIVPYLNTDKANINAYTEEKSLTIHTDTATNANKAFTDLIDALVADRIKLFDFTRWE